MLGLPIGVDETVTLYDPPVTKRWCTAGVPQLIVIARYCVQFTLAEVAGGTAIRILIDHDLPERGWNRDAGALLGHSYAR